jgi:hypothetical protein
MGLVTEIMDILPAIPGYKEAWGKGQCVTQTIRRPRVFTNRTKALTAFSAMDTETIDRYFSMCWQLNLWCRCLCSPTETFATLFDSLKMWPCRRTTRWSCRRRAQGLAIVQRDKEPGCFATGGCGDRGKIVGWASSSSCKAIESTYKNRTAQSRGCETMLETHNQ